IDALRRAGNLTRQHTPLPPAKDLGCPLDLGTAVYFGARDEVVGGKPGGWLLRWRLPLFACLFRNLGSSGRSVQSSAAQLLGNWASDRDLAEERRTASFTLPRIWSCWAWGGAAAKTL